MALRGRFGSARREADARHRALSRGDAVALPCRLRRTSARGWGPWTSAELVLGALPDGGARWRAPDPIAVGFPATRGPVDLPFTDVVEVAVRPVRFQTEAFHGMAAEIVVVVADPSTIELALPPGESALALDRLVELLPDGAARPQQ